MDSLSKEVNLIIISSVFLFAVAIGIIILTLIYQKKQIQFTKEKEQFKIILDKEILEAQLEIQEQTLRNISQEIHDNIGQTLSLAKLNLNTINLQKQNAQEKITQSKELVSEAIKDLRNLSKSLSTDSILSSGLLKAIETELAIIDHSGSFKTEFHIKGYTKRINPKKELILFRIVQESINNIIKHSDANRILINLDFTNEYLRIEVCDNGKGFNADTETSEGLGLRNMKNRAELIGGTFDIFSNYDGTTMKVTIPITES
jgi:signal transduction histidine kinase